MIGQKRIILIDFDHILEFFYNQPQNFWRLKIALSGHHFQQAGKIRVWFHAWEYLIIWTAIWLWQGWYKIGLITSLPYFSHLLMDHFGNETCGPFYFLLYRLKNNFDIRKLCRKLCQKPQ